MIAVIGNLLVGEGFILVTARGVLHTPLVEGN
jgi:hypothetical protein